MLSVLTGCLDGGDEGGYVSPTNLYSGCPPNPVFGSDFWKVEINTVEVSCLAGGGFVKRRPTKRERDREVLFVA
ncbi:hypothetical protein RHMOL_Rhmol06G0145400 [Rhododendron molle]|uniref:Uncharacterized protein n=1 Tax=Rhododendron molle TaxID=49168 RepID=A0ACC0NDQ7_RHOML|nr:hypothetical protein RHMOL_Rhmol06G0145400 [Rhododendron molle]